MTLALFVNTACNPVDLVFLNQAIGNSASPDDPNQEVHYDNVVIANIEVTLIGAANDENSSVEQTLLQACSRAQMPTTYVSIVQTNSPVESAVTGMKDAADRAVSMIIISGIDAGESAQTHDQEQWEQGLSYVRSMGIPVALLEPVSVPSDDALYAAIIRIDKDAHQAAPLVQTLEDIMNNVKHDRDIVVSGK